MRRRLILSTLAIALTSVFVLGLPLLLLARHQVWTSEREQLREQAASVATALEDRLDAGQPVDIHRLPNLLPRRQILIQQADGATLIAGPKLTGAVLSSSVHVAGSIITVRASKRPTNDRALNVTLLVLGIALTAVLASLFLALWQARRLARPLADLASRADRLGRGDFDLSPMVSGVPEVDHISRVLKRSSRQVGTLLELQRNFASDAAHQLRTPLTGIGLRLEEIGRIGDTPVREEALDALGQVERLDRVITSLLARARGDSSEPTVLDLAEVIDAEMRSWREVLGRENRDLILRLEPQLLVLARHEHLLGVLNSLLDNAVRHGRGAVRVSTQAVDDLVTLRVRDCGPGVADHLTQKVFERRFSGGPGTGIGLALARALATAEEGTLTVSEVDPAEFVLQLPRYTDSAKAGGRTSV
ncbi:MAG: histidine kinase [Mycobacterium sp.]|nr:histidine kinase [Mycobacterium sp.]